MADETKVTVAPVTTEATEESQPDDKRAQLEKLVIASNEHIPEVESETPPPKPEEVKEEPDSEDPVERIKKSVQKRIDKVVAQKKSAEEELIEARAEIERLKNAKPEEKPVTPKDDTPPTPEQVEAYIVKMREEGNVKEEIAATRYLIKLEKELALKEVRDEQNKTSKEAEAVKQKQLNDWVALSNDYVVYNPDGTQDLKSDLNLANQKGLLYQTALSLYNDKDLHKDFYNDPNVMNGFRRAVADAFREIHQQGLIKTPKGESITPVKRSIRETLADPSADSGEEVEKGTISNSLSDAEKVREEIKARNKNRFKR